MWLIVGLGNPGKEYNGTRHNIGFEVIDRLAKENSIDINKAKFRSQLGEGMIGNKKVILAKPQTYMNLSGECLRELINYYKPFEDEILIIYDDIALMPSEIRIRDKGSAGGHNGIKNIIQHLDTDTFLRVRVGVGEKPKNWDLADYVLSKFKTDEQESMDIGIEKSCKAVELLLNNEVSYVMNLYNRKAKKDTEI